MTYQIDPAHSAVQFKIRHMMIAFVRGEFGKVTGTVEFDPANPGATRVDASIDVNSLATRDPNRDGHLKGPDFFDAANHPAITFKSNGVAAAGPGSFKVSGDLTFRGVTKAVTLTASGVSDKEVKDPWGNLRRGLEATTRLNRRDFGITFDAALEGGVAMLGDDVEISMDLELTRKP
jgi:polyisoprenoid-binding protein YceI